MGIYELVRPYADEDGDRVALISDVDGVRSFAQVIGRSEQAGLALDRQLGLGVGDRVCLWLTNRIEWFECYIGAESSSAWPPSRPIRTGPTGRWNSSSAIRGRVPSCASRRTQSGRWPSPAGSRLSSTSS
jgi:hypothetical protein